MRVAPEMSWSETGISLCFFVCVCQGGMVSPYLAGCPIEVPPDLLASPNAAEACGSRSVYDGPEQEEYSTFIIDDPQETYKTLKQVITGVGALEQEHAQYRRDKFKKTKYGSQ